MKSLKKVIVIGVAVLIALFTQIESLNLFVYHGGL